MTKKRVIIRKTRPGGTTKKWQYSREEANKIKEDEKYITPDAKITIRPVGKNRGRTIRTGKQKSRS